MPAKGWVSPESNERLDAWVKYRQQGRTIKQAAYLMSIETNVLEKLLQRARDRGDQRGIVRQLPASIVGHCKADGCGVPMQSSTTWRAGIRVRGAKAGHGGHGLCMKHYWRWRKNGRTDIKPLAERNTSRPGHTRAPVVKAEDLLYDWELLRSEGLTWRQAAPRIGVSESAMDQALRRARKRGDTRGNLYPHHPTRSAA